MKKYPYPPNCKIFTALLVIIFFNASQLRAQFLNTQGAESRIIRDNEQSIFIKKTKSDNRKLRNSRKISLSDKKPDLKKAKKTSAINCFDINKFTLDSNKILSQDFFISITNKYIGKCLSSNDIEKIKSILNSKILDNGYITSQIIVPNQSLISEELRFNVFIGKIDNISVQSYDKEQLAKKFLIIGDLKDTILNINKINIQNIQLNNISANNYKVKLTPANNIGKTDILFKNHPRERNIFADASHNNLGNNFTGRYRSILNLSTQDLLTINDKIDINVSDNLNDANDSKNLLTSFISITVPFRSYYIEASTSQSKFNGKFSSDQGTYIVKGKSSRKSIAIDKIIFNNKKLSLNLGSSISSRKSSSETYLTGLVNSTKKDFTNIEVFNSGSAQINRSSSIYHRASIIRGIESDNEEVKSDILSPKYNFQLYRLFVNFNKKFSIYEKQLTFSSQFNAQISQDVLHGADQFSVGGFQSVRGFSENYITGDHGFFTRNSINLGLTNFVNANNFLYKIRLSTFFDYGKVSNRINSDSGNLSGAGIALDYDNKFLNLSVTYAKSFNESSLIDSQTIENEFLYFNIRIKFL